MFSRISSSWELVKASYRVLRADKELIVFPIVSALGTLAVMITFAVPMLLAGLFDSATNDGLGVAHYAVAFLFYLTMYFVVIFSNTALVGAAMIRLRGGDPTLADGFKIAMDHVPQIFGYAMISATVGVVLRVLQERGGIVGQIVAWIGNLAWNVVTYLVIPVLVVENVGPVEAIKRSGSLLKRTWGEQIIGNFSIGLVFGLLSLAVIVVFGLPAILFAAATGSVVLIVLAVALIVMIVIGLNLISSTLQGIYVAALYRYAVEGVVDENYFPPELVEGAFRKKK
ncbi:MAG: hypothetical protein JW966_05855 [Anaerolineae bacterium]|nr:hypothetical protein [Anaerolineae bacterium]